MEDKNVVRAIQLLIGVLKSDEAKVGSFIQMLQDYDVDIPPVGSLCWQHMVPVYRILFDAFSHVGVEISAKKVRFAIISSGHDMKRSMDKLSVFNDVGMITIQRNGSIIYNGPKREAKHV